MKILRKIYRPFCDRGEWRIRFNQELHNIYDDIDVVKRIQSWLGHVLRVDTHVRKVFEYEAGGGSRKKGRRCQCWAEQMDENGFNAVYPKLAPSCNSA